LGKKVGVLIPFCPSHFGHINVENRGNNAIKAKQALLYYNLLPHKTITILKLEKDD